MKTEIIGKNGNVVAGQKDPKATYVEHDKDSVRIHLSETDKVTKDQIVAIGNLLAIAGKGKAMTQVTQHSKNVVGFTLAKEPDAAKSKASIQVAYNAVVAEAKRVNAQQNGGNNGAQQQSRGNQSGNGGQQSQGNQGQQNGSNSGAQRQAQGNNAQQSRGGNNGAQQQTQGNNAQQSRGGNNGAQQQTQGNNAQSRGNQSGNGGQRSQGNQGQQNGGNNGAQQQSRGNQSGNGGQQSQGNQGQQNGGNAQQSNNNAQQPDKTKDIFGRPLKQSYPGLFWSGMSPQEEQSAFDSYWDMVHHVDKDIFHKK